MIDLGLEGARAVVIGAGYIPERAGNGRAVALNLGRAGATVACIDIDAGRAEDTAQAVIDAGGKAFALTGDVLDSINIATAIDEAAARHGGGLDVCVNVIGTAWWKASVDVTDNEWDRAIQMNLTQVFYTLRAAAPHLSHGKGSSFTALSSSNGSQSARMHASYGAAKAGVISLMQTFAEELGPQGVRVNSVSPGNVGMGNLEDAPAAFGSDPMNPLAPPRATDIADAVLFLSSKLASRITGQNLLVDGGNRMANSFTRVPTTQTELPKTASYADTSE